MKNIAIILARSGSKGLPDKNIRPLNGQPLLSYSVQAAIESGMFDTVMVSTDSEKYADIAIRYGAEVPFLRSPEMSNDTANSWDAALEVVNKYKSQGKVYDTICLLQPTSPLRTAGDIKEGYKLFEEKVANAVTAVCRADHPLEYYTLLDEDKLLDSFRERIKEMPRQMYKQYYRINGALYIRRMDITNNNISFTSGKEYAYIMDNIRSVDIDTIDDFEYAEFLMNKNKE